MTFFCWLLNLTDMYRSTQRKATDIQLLSQVTKRNRRAVKAMLARVVQLLLYTGLDHLSVRKLVPVIGFLDFRTTIRGLNKQGPTFVLG